MLKDRTIKVDVFDVSKIKVKLPNAIVLGEMNTFIGKFYFVLILIVYLMHIKTAQIQKNSKQKNRRNFKNNDKVYRIYY